MLDRFFSFLFLKFINIQSPVIKDIQNRKKAFSDVITDNLSVIKNLVDFPICISASDYISNMIYYHLHTKFDLFNGQF